LIRRCLAKKRSDRLRHIGDARMDLVEAIGALEAPSATEETQARRGVRSGRLGIAAVVLLIAAAAAAGWFVANRFDAVPSIEHYDISTIRPPGGLGAGDRILAISPDGSRVAYATPESLVVYSVKSGVTIPLGRGTEPFFSPDSKSLAFFSDGRLVRVSADGGVPTVLSTVQSRIRGASWGSDGRIVFATDQGLYRTPESGGEPERLVSPDPKRGELHFAWPTVLPGDRTVLFTIAPQDAANGSQIAALDLTSLTYTTLIQGGGNARYLQTGRLIYSVEGQLTAVEFDPRSLRVGTAPVALSYRVRPAPPNFDVSATGTLVFAPVAPPPNSTKVWVHPKDGSEAQAGLPRNYIYSRLSPDGKMVIGDANVNGNRDLFIWDFERQIETQLTTAAKEDLFAMWSPDSRTVYFTSNRNGRMELFSVPADRSKRETRLYGDSDFEYWLFDVLPDGSALMATRTRGNTTEFLTLTLAGTPKVRSVLSLEGAALNAVVSPDGQWFAYQSNETKKTEIWVRSLGGANPAQHQASRAGGRNPRWSHDGRTLYYQDFSGAMVAVQVIYEPEFRLGAVTEVFPNRGYTGVISGSLVPNSGRVYDIARDGRFLTTKTLPTEALNSIRVVRNFLAEMR
jgi:Tol biopolymer transport system component